MKYGLLTYSSAHPNIGDRYQLIGIIKAYERLKIPASEIIEVDRDYLADYDGEYVVLPIASFVDALPGTRIFPLSPKIVPVFIGTHCIDDQHLRYMEHYKSFGPFGCRDMETVRRLRKMGMDAYLSGCLSCCTDRRETLATQTKVFLVDVSEELKSHIPDRLLSDSVEVTHEYSMPADEYTRAERTNQETQLADAMLERYRTEAKLVITSRLHCALPCTGMGIPVIVARDMNAREHRFEGVDKLLNYYTSNQYGQINWSPESLDIKELKEHLIDLAAHMISTAYAKYHRLCDISTFFENQPLRIYYSGIHSGYLTMRQKREYLSHEMRERDLLSYIRGRDISTQHLIIFGAGDKGKWMYPRYRQSIARFKSCRYVDNNTQRQGSTIQGIKVDSPQVINNYSKDNITIIVAADNYYEGAGLAIANELIRDYGMVEGKHFFMLDKLNASSLLYLDDIGTVESWADGF